MKKSNRSNVDPFIVMDVMEAARKAEQSGKKIVHMEVGQPGTPAPKVANEYITKEDPKIKGEAADKISSVLDEFSADFA